MSGLPLILLAAWLAGLASFVGGCLAALESTLESDAKQGLIHGVIAFGGGVLIAAVAFALTPEGIDQLDPLPLFSLFVAGGAIFCGVDYYLERRGGGGAQMMAMLLDFVPESLALGAVFERDHKAGLLLALFIGAQNLPEGFNSFRELTGLGASRRAALWGLMGASLFGPVAAASGYWLLRENTEMTAGIMTFAAGGILYLVFQDIAPQAQLRHKWTPPLGAVLGFAVGMLGQKLLGG